MAPSLVTAIQTCECGTRIDVGKFDLFQEVQCPACARLLTVTGQLDRFELVGRAGNGTGTVYTAFDPQLGRHVALRIVEMESSLREEIWRQLENETLVAACIQHPNVLKVHEVGRTQGRFYIVMELAPGGTLADLLRNHPVLHEVQALDFAHQIASGLDAVFRTGLLHRDLKPRNVLFINSVAKVADFGLAGFQEKVASEEGCLWGDPHYMAPERVAGAREDAQSDIYALGAVLFEMLCGRPPFHVGNAQEIAARRLKQAAPSVLTFAPEVSDSTAMIVKRMLEKDRKTRFRSYSELLDQLNAAREEVRQTRRGRKENRVVIAPPKQRKVEPWLKLAIAVFLVVAAVAGTVAVQTYRARNVVSETPSTSPALAKSGETWSRPPNRVASEAALPAIATGPDSLAELQAMAPGVFRFVNVANRWSLHVASMGLDEISLVTTWHNGQALNSHWWVRPVNGGYQLVAFHSYKALEALADPKDERVPIRQASLNDSPAQVWKVEPADNGACRLISAFTGKALAIADPKAINVSVVGQRASPGNTMEQWKIEFVRSTPPEFESIPKGVSQLNSPECFEAKKTVEPLGGRFVPINLAANRDSRDPKAFEERNTNPILRISTPGWREVNGVPFQILDAARVPDGKDQLILRGPRDLSQKYPDRVELVLPISHLTKLHFLGGVAGWGLIPDSSHPTGGRFGAVVVNVIVERVGGARENFQLRNGLEIIDWVAQSEVPLSTRVQGLSTDGEFRYFSKELTGSGSVSKIILECTGNCAAPVFLAITGESGR